MRQQIVVAAVLLGLFCHSAHNLYADDEESMVIKGRILEHAKSLASYPRLDRFFPSADARQQIGDDYKGEVKPGGENRFEISFKPASELANEKNLHYKTRPRRPLPYPPETDAGSVASFLLSDAP